MATSEEENRFWRDPELRARFFDWDPETGWYRRFFDIGDLAGVRVEDPEVFEQTHRKVLELVRDGHVDGLRIDHPDGLANPREYLERLREHGVERIWVEKIIEPGEQLRADWPVQGTTGYEFANDVTALFVDPAGKEPLTELYAELTGERRTFADVAYEAKLEVAGTTFEREFDRLRALCPFDDLEEAAAALHVYRTYVEPYADRVDDEDRRAVEALPAELRAVLLLEGERSAARDEFVVRWQQTTGPVMAKGVEDTAFYRWFRLTALNEVGGNPDRFSLSTGSSAIRKRSSPRRRTTRSAPATSGRGSARSRHSTRSGPSRSAAGMPSRAASTIRTRSTSSGRRSSVRGRLSPAASSCTSRRRSVRRSAPPTGSIRTKRTSGA
jgi:(1->4)-alpha-D-glucan 1-alpha-D-glucosylmutase